MSALLRARTGGIGLLVAIIAALPLALPNAYYYDVAIQIGINATVVIGLNLLIGYAGQISLGHAGFIGLGAYGSAILTGTYGWPPLLALAFDTVAIGALALLIARPILHLRGHYLAMATLGLGIIVSIVLNTEDEFTGGPDGMTVPPLSVLGLEIYGERIWYWLIGALLVLAVWLALNLVDSPVGRALRALHGSEIAAQVAGIDTTRYKVRVFVLSAVFAGLMGGLGAHYAGFVTPSGAGFLRSIELVTMVVLGGLASTFGAVVGAAILTVLPQVLTGFQDYEMMVFGLILMVTMIAMPRGLVPSLATAFARLRR